MISGVACTEAVLTETGLPIRGASGHRDTPVCARKPLRSPPYAQTLAGKRKPTVNR